MKLEMHLIIVVTTILNVLASGFDPSEKGFFIRGKYFRIGRISTRAVKSDETPAHIFRQCVDHNFANCNNNSWNQRYWQKWTQYKNGGPVFFMFGGEGDSEDLIDFYFETYAKHYGAVLLVLEHRFYGQSFPTENNPVTIEDLKLLSSQQTLMDGVKFVQKFKESHNITEAKVVAFGGSYPGNLAAWARQKYPQIFNLAVASSAPLEARYDFSEYVETVSEVIKEIDKNCFNRIKASFTCMETLVDNGVCNNSQIESKADIPLAINDCYNYDMDEKAQTELFFYRLQNYWRSNKPATKNLKKCEILNKQENKDAIGLYGDFRLETKKGQKNCTGKSKRSNTTKTYISNNNPNVNNMESASTTAANRNQDFMTFIKSKDGRDAHSWTWQTCSEFGYFQTPDPRLKLFGTGWSTDIDVERCQLAFPAANFTSDLIQTRIKRTNEIYKGKKFDGSCTIFVNGQWDPWHRLGINSQVEVKSSNYVVSIPKGEHCDDMVACKKPEVKLAQAEIQRLIGEYLNNPNC